MAFLDILNMAFGNIKANFLRTILTISIIAIGIMALVGILTALDGITHALSNSFTGLGANSFEIKQKQEEGRGPHGARLGDVISYRQAIEFKRRYASNAKVALSAEVSITATAKFKKKATSPNIRVIGIDENYLDVHGYKLVAGRNLSETEIKTGTHKVIVGSEIVKELFDGSSDRAIGNSIMVGNMKYRVIGVKESVGQGAGGVDRIAMVPIPIAKMVYGPPQKGYKVVIRENNTSLLESAMMDAGSLFRQVRRLKLSEADDFEIAKADAMIAMLEENTATLRISTIAIGLITLLGAAIGLMNIMLVSVTERTKEIGVNKALGATKSDIRQLFLMEALIIGLLGGLIGIVLGVIVGNIVPQQMGGQFIMPWGWLALGIGLCLVVGVASGYYPAKRAAAMDPIDALRHE